MKQFMTVLGFLLCLGLASSAAEAGLIGTAMDAVYYYPDVGTPYTGASFTPAQFVVGAGQETVGNVEGVTQLLINVSDSDLTIILHTILSLPTWGPAPFNGVILASPDGLDISSATVDPATTMAGFDNSRITFGPNEIVINWNGLPYSDGTAVKVDFGFVPEPDALTLLGAGLLGMTAIRRRREG